MENNINVLLADHHPLFRQGLRSMMEDDKKFHFKWDVNDGDDLIPNINKFDPDLVILEIDLPNAQGVGTLRNLRAVSPKMKILVVSCHPEEIYALSSIKAGANGYISKVRTVKQVRNALETICNGGTYLSQEIRENIESNKRKSEILKFKKLSTREIEVLNLLSRGKRNKEIAQDLSINEKTVSTYKTRLLKKLNVDNIADLITQSRLLQIAD